MALLLAFLLSQGETDKSRIEAVLAQAEESAAAYKEAYLRSKAWAEVAEVRAEWGDLDGTIKLLDRIPDAYERLLGYASAAKVLAKAGRGEPARQLVMLGLKAAGEGQPDFKTGNAYAHLVVALAESGDMAGAIRRIEAIPEGFSDRQFATVDIAACLASRGEIRKAIDLLKSIPVRDRDWKTRDVSNQAIKHIDPAAVQPLAETIGDIYLRGITQEETAKELLHRGRTEEAVETARSIGDKRAQTSALCFLARELVGKNNELVSTLLSSAQTAARQVPDAWGKVRALSLAARSWGRAGNPKAAAKLVPEVERARNDLTEEMDRVRSLTAVAIALASAGNIDGALDLVSAEAKTREWMLGEIAEELAELRDFEAALRFCRTPFDRAQVMFQKSKVETRPEEARKLLVDVMDLMDKVDAGLKDLNDIRNGKPEQKLLYDLQEALAASGDFDAVTRIALRQWKDMGHWFGAFSLRSAARLQAEAGKLDLALAWIAKLDDPLGKSLALTGAAEGAIRRAKR